MSSALPAFPHSSTQLSVVRGHLWSGPLGAPVLGRLVPAQTCCPTYLSLRVSPRELCHLPERIREGSSCPGLRAPSVANPRGHSLGVRTDHACAVTVCRVKDQCQPFLSVGMAFLCKIWSHVTLLLIAWSSASCVLEAVVQRLLVLVVFCLVLGSFCSWRFLSHEKR